MLLHYKIQKKLINVQKQKFRNLAQSGRSLAKSKNVPRGVNQLPNPLQDRKRDRQFYSQ